MLPLRVEPFVLKGFKLFGSVELCEFLVKDVEQMLVVGHELIFAVGHVYRRQFKIVDKITVHQPFQGERVPHNLSFLAGTDLLNDLPDVLFGNGIFLPAVVLHEVVAKRAAVHNDLHARLTEVAEGLNQDGLVFRCHHTLREKRDGILAVEAVFVVEADGQSEH